MKPYQTELAFGGQDHFLSSSNWRPSAKASNEALSDGIGLLVAGIMWPFSSD